MHLIFMPLQNLVDCEYSVLSPVTTSFTFCHVQFNEDGIFQLYARRATKEQIELAAKNIIVGGYKS